MNENNQLVGKFVKFIQFPLTRIVLGFVILIAVPSLIQIGMGALIIKDTMFTELITVLLTVAGALFSYYGFVRLIEKRSVSELSLPHATKELGSGLLLGAALFSATIAILWVLGYYQVSGINQWQGMLGWLFIGILSGNEAKGLLQSTLNGPVLLSGGEFGVKASIFAVIICLAAGIYFVWRSYQQGKFINPFWKN